jgi:hypothetical protein
MSNCDKTSANDSPPIDSGDPGMALGVGVGVAVGVGVGDGVAMGPKVMIGLGVA